MSHATYANFWDFPLMCIAVSRTVLKARWIRKSPPTGSCKISIHTRFPCLFLAMPRARKSCTRTKRARRTRRSTEDTLEKAEMGGSASSRNDDPAPKEEESTSLQSTLTARIIESPLPLRLPLSLPLSQRQPLPEEPDYSKICPICSSTLKPAVDPVGRNTSLLQCPQCSKTPLCEKCLYPCPDGTCTNQSCQIVSVLLTCDRVRKPSSKVYGCPLFRACPKCHNVMMHDGGCKYVWCDKCRHAYCFICLRISQDCRKDRDMYWSLTCSAPKAARQRFQT